MLFFELLFAQGLIKFISKMAKNLFLYVTFHCFSFAYQTLITVFGSPTFIYSQHGFYKYRVFSFFHLFL